MTIICFICFYAVGIYEIMSNDYENEQNRTYSHIENDMYLPQYMKDLLKPPPKNLRPESEYYRSGTGYSRHWSALGDIEKMIMVFVAGFFIATLFFFTILDEEKEWFMIIFLCPLFIGTFFFLALDTNYGYLVAFIGILIGSAMSIWRRNH